MPPPALELVPPPLTSSLLTSGLFLLSYVGREEKLLLLVQMWEALTPQRSWSFSFWLRLPPRMDASSNCGPRGKHGEKKPPKLKPCRNLFLERNVYCIISSFSDFYIFSRIFFSIFILVMCLIVMHFSFLIFGWLIMIFWYCCRIFYTQYWFVFRGHLINCWRQISSWNYTHNS